jgi:hypothetical protein
MEFFAYFEDVAATASVLQPLRWRSIGASALWKAQSAPTTVFSLPAFLHGCQYLFGFLFISVFARVCVSEHLSVEHAVDGATAYALESGE